MVRGLRDSKTMSTRFDGNNLVYPCSQSMQSNTQVTRQVIFSKSDVGKVRDVATPAGSLAIMEREARETREHRALQAEEETQEHRERGKTGARAPRGAARQEKREHRQPQAGETVQSRRGSRTRRPVGVGIIP